MEEAKKEFLKYAESYLAYGEKIELKMKHTFRVVNLCEEIARKKGLTEEEIELAKLCGLLHDIARFEQYKRYQTFADSKSIDHGDLGVEILKENHFISKFSVDKAFEPLILKAVKYHNKYALPEDLTEQERLFCNLVRDADKIDILYLYTTGGISLPIDDDIFSEGILNQLKNESVVKRTTEETKADKLAISLGFVFDIAFQESIHILRKKDYINQEIDIYKNKATNPKLKEQLEEIRMIIHRYMDRREEDVR